MNKYIQVMTTVASKAKANELAKHVLKLRLVACVQIIPCDSLYHWQGKIEQNQELLCIMKTMAELFTKLQTAIEQVHSYEVAEIIATEIVGGNSDYFAWLESELSSK